jgi:hypothetical protein
VTVSENVNVIHSKILDNQTISAKELADTLAISLERIGCIIHDILDMRKLQPNGFPHVSMPFRSVIE